MKAFRLFCVVTVLALTLFTFTPVQAQAKAPVAWEGDFSGTMPINCGSFEINIDWTNHAEGKDFYDSQGNWVLTLAHLNVHAVATNSVTGKNVSGSAHFNLHDTPDYFSERGVKYHFVAPGAGTVYVNAGLAISFDGISYEIIHGPHPAYEGDFSALCAYLQ